MYEILSSPIMGLIALIIGILGIVISVFIYSISRKHPGLSYKLFKDRTIILKNGQTSDLRVYHREKIVIGDLTSAKIMIWNSGRECIKKENILSELQIDCDPKVQILETKVLRMSRKIVEFDLDRSFLSEGRIPVEWRILEKGDGAIVQIVYEGPPDVDIRLNGFVEGQKKIYKQEIEDINLKKSLLAPLSVIAMSALFIIYYLYNPLILIS